MNHGYNTRYYAYTAGDEYTEEEARRLTKRQQNINLIGRVCWCLCCSLFMLFIITLTVLSNLESRNIINFTLI